MTTELRVRNQSQSIYLTALTAAWRNREQLHDPSLWLLRDPQTEEKMLRDADIASAFNIRRHMIASRDWKVIARRVGSERAPMATMVATELLKNIKHHTQARLNLAGAFLSGAKFADIKGEPRVLTLGDGRPRTWWVPTAIVDLDKRNFRQVPEYESDELVGAHWERWNVGRGRFEVETVDGAVTTIRHLYQDDQASLGHGRALREALGWWWWAKTHVLGESLQAVERFAQGILVAKVEGARDGETGMPNTELITAWKAVLEDLRSRHVLVYDASDNVEHVQMSGEGWQVLSDLRAELKETITTLILGANLPTTATEGGSFALGGIQQDSTEQLVQFDRAELDETLSDALIGCLWFKNRPNLVELGIAEDDEQPLYSIAQEKLTDPQERANVASTLNGMGVELSRDDVLEQTGFRRPDPGEDIIPGGSPAPSPFGGGGGGFAPPFQRTG